MCNVCIVGYVCSVGKVFAVGNVCITVSVFTVGYVYGTDYVCAFINIWVTDQLAPKSTLT